MQEWWNATTVGEYWRLWNQPVHKWMLRHVYFPCLRAGLPKFWAGERGRTSLGRLGAGLPKLSADATAHMQGVHVAGRARNAALLRSTANLDFPPFSSLLPTPPGLMVFFISAVQQCLCSDC